MADEPNPIWSLSLSLREDGSWRGATWTTNPGTLEPTSETTIELHPGNDPILAHFLSVILRQRGVFIGRNPQATAEDDG